MNKKVLIILGIVILIILVCLVVFLFVQRKPQPTQTATQTTFPMATSSAAATSEPPANFVHDFFNWYLTVGDNLNASNYPSYDQQLSQWITPEFHSQLDTIIADTNQSPFVLAQDIPPDWRSNINTQLVSASTDSAIVDVTLGTATDQQTLQVTVVPVNGQWRISKVKGL